MIYVVLRSGKVLQYNTAASISQVNGVFHLDTTGGKYFVAQIPQDLVERVEAKRPCRIMRERPIKKLPLR